jgi:mono/diheme cytochrome c family protein
MPRAARLLARLGLVAALLGGATLFITRPQTLAASEIASGRVPDLENGARLFWAGGCASCHAAKGAKGEDRLKLGGGAPLETPFGTFHGPNLSPHPDGLGDWTLAEFANAMQRGTGRSSGWGGRHLYPAFPYTSYVRLTPDDVADLFGFLKTLPAVPGKAPDNDLAFPFNLRFGIGAWKLLFMEDARPIAALGPDADAAVLRGQYLVEGPGHCGQCHTPRTANGVGSLDHSHWLAGAPNPEGKGRIPNITPARLKWSADEIADYLATGFTPDYDSVGGTMVEVQENMAKLPAEDRAAIAAYLKAIPARE